jgi:hypothetical protein
MSISTVFTIGINADGKTYSASKTAVGTRRVQYNESIPASVMVTVAEAIDQSAIQSVYMKATGGEVTLVTNGGGTGTSDTLTIPTSGDIWYAGMNAACPFTMDITEFELYHSVLAAVAVEIDIMVDATP